MYILLDVLLILILCYYHCCCQYHYYYSISYRTYCIYLEFVQVHVSVCEILVSADMSGVL